MIINGLHYESIGTEYNVNLSNTISIIGSINNDSMILSELKRAMMVIKRKVANPIIITNNSKNNLIAQNVYVDYGIPVTVVLDHGFVTPMDNDYMAYTYKRIVDNGGLIVSPFNDGFEKSSDSFIKRDEFIVDMSKVVFVPRISNNFDSIYALYYANKTKKTIMSFDDLTLSIRNKIINDVSEIVNSL